MESEYIAGNGLRKHFGGSIALDDVSISVPKGSWIGLVGENGAGKSTLLRILAGVLRPDAGEVRIGGQRRELTSSRDANQLGVFLWSQTGEYVPALSLYENVFLGYHRWFKRRGLLDHRAMRLRAEPHIRMVLGEDVNVNSRMETVGYGHRQLFQMARILACADLLSISTPLLLIDEATAALDEGQSGRLFELLSGLHKSGATIVYVSHRLRELMGTAERIIVMRDGKTTASVSRSDATESTLHSLMVGRERAHNYYLEEVRRPLAGARVLEAMGVSGSSAAGHVDDVSLTMRRGEIVGMAGVEGSGKEVLARLLSGAEKVRSGSVTVSGRAVPLRRDNPRAALRRGIGLLPVDRLGESLIAGQSITFNVTLAAGKLPRPQRKRTGKLVLRHAELRQRAGPLVKQMDVSPPNLDLPVEALSGGNQQKVALAKWALADVEVLIAVDPTQGVDVGARQECYRFFRQFCRDGKSVLLVSNDLPELIGLSNRVMVMRNGQVVGEVSCDGTNVITEEMLVGMMIS